MNFSIAVFLSTIGFIWVTVILARLLIRKKKHKRTLTSLIWSKIKHDYSKTSFEYLFQEVEKLLKYSIPDKNYNYHLPCYLALGTQKSHKTTLIANLGLEQMLEAKKSRFLNWYFLNQGIILDAHEDLLLQENSNSWFNFLKVLKDRRSAKPINGIIVFISLRELANFQDMSELLQEADSMYAKLLQIQQKLKMKLPVYINFTQLNLIPGFETFCNLIPTSLHHNIFGWSCPYSVEQNFRIAWIEEMFKTMEENFEIMLSELMLKGEASQNEKILEFMHSFKFLKNNIAKYLEVLFKNNNYSEALYFRGAYFSAFDKFSEQEYAANIPSLPSEFGHSKISIVIEQKKLFFIQELFTKKIFPERNIAISLEQEHFQKRYINLVKFGIACSLIASTNYLFKVYYELEKINQKIIPQMDHLLQILKIRENKVDDIEFMENMKTVVDCIADISCADTQFYFIPYTLVSSLNSEIFDLLEKINNEVLVKLLKEHIERRYYNLAHSKIKFSNKIANPVENSAFLKLNHFILHLNELQILEEKFISAQKNGNVVDYAYLLFKIIGINTSIDFEKHEKFFEEVLMKNKLDFSTVAKSKEHIIKRFKKLLRIFYKKAFNYKHFVKNLSEIKKLLHMLKKEDESFTLNDLQRLQECLTTLITYSNDAHFHWLKEKEFHFEKFEKFIFALKKSNLFDQKFITEIEHKVKHRFIRLKKRISKIQLPLIDYLFYLDEHGVQISPSLFKIQGSINTVFAENFMQSYEKTHLKQMHEEQFSLWDNHFTNEAVAIFKEYESFVKHKLESYPRYLYFVLQRQLKKRVIGLIESKLHSAQKIVPISHDNEIYQEYTDNIKLNYANIASLIKHLRNFDNHLFYKLKKLEKQRCLKALHVIDKATEGDRIYVLNNGSYSVDEFFKKVCFNFNVENYLALERKRLEFYSINLMNPVLKMLKYIDSFDNETLDLIAQKWENIEIELENYAKNLPSVDLKDLEDFIRKVDKVKLEDLQDSLALDVEVKQERYFKKKVYDLKKEMLAYINTSVGEILVRFYKRSFAFYSKYKSCFPFYLEGNVMSVEAASMLSKMVQEQEAYLALVDNLSRDFDPNILEFMKSLHSISVLIKHLILKENSISVKVSDFLVSEYQHNLSYVLSIKSRFNREKFVEFPTITELKIEDIVEFEIEIVQSPEIAITVEQYYKIEGNKVKFRFDKYSFIKFLFENAFIKNGKLYIEFKISITKNGNKDEIIVALPIEFKLDGICADFPLNSYKYFKRVAK